MEKMISVSVMLSMSGVNKAKVIQEIKANPLTGRDGEYGEWSVETSGKEDQMFSPFLRKPFENARESGVIPANLDTIAGTWGAIYDTGDLTYAQSTAFSGRPWTAATFPFA